MKKNKSIAAIIIVLFFGSYSYSQNFIDALRLSEKGVFPNARAMGMGNSYMAVGNDYTSALFNPAALGLIKKTSFTFGLNNLTHSNDVTFFNKSTSAEDNEVNFNQVGAVIPFPTKQGSFVIGLGYNQVQDFANTINFSGYNAANNSKIQDLLAYGTDKDLEYLYKLGISYEVRDNNGKYLYDETKIAGGLQQEGLFKDAGTLSNWNFAAAVEFNKDLYLGASMNFYSGDYKKDKSYYEIDEKNKYADDLMLDDSDTRTAGFESFLYKELTDWKISGFDLKFGFLLCTDRGFNLAAAVKIPTYFTIQEKYKIFAQSEFKNQSFSVDGLISSDFEYEIKTPFEFSIGGSYERDNLLLTAQAEIINYKQMEFTEGLGSQESLDRNLEIDNLFRSVVNFNAGLEYQLSDMIKLRAGFIFQKSPYKDDDSKYDKKFLTGGLGFALNRQLNLDLGYSYGWWENFSDNYDFNLSRNYQKLSRSNMSLSITYNL